MPDNRSRSQITKTLFLCSVSFFSLFLGFSTNHWRVADQHWFTIQPRPTEAFIIARLLKSHHDGIFSAGGLTGWGVPQTPPASETEYQSWLYTAYDDDVPFPAYTTYNSQIGGQGMLFGILDKWTTRSPQERLRLFHTLTSLLAAATLTAVVLWFYWEFGFIVGLFVIASAVLSQWLVVFGRDLYWSIWAFYVPIAVLMHYLRVRPDRTTMRYLTFGVVVFVSVFIKCLFNGYEYITPTLVMMLVPFIYYAFVDLLNIRRLLTGVVAAGVSSCLAILLTFIILCFQIASVEGHFSAGVDHIVYSLEKRTHGDYRKFKPSYTASLTSSTTDVVVTYLNSTFFNVDSSRFVPQTVLSRVCTTCGLVRYSQLILLFLLMSGILYAITRRSGAAGDRRRYDALIVATWFSMLAPLSWFIVFTAHAYIHTYYDSIVWQMPFVFFGFAVCGAVCQHVWRSLAATATDSRRRSSVTPSGSATVSV
jgi:hypothetical protein